MASTKLSVMTTGIYNLSIYQSWNYVQKSVKKILKVDNVTNRFLGTAKDTLNVDNLDEKPPMS